MPSIDRSSSLQRQVRIGSQGDAVRELQEGLNAAGFPVEVDGMFGPRTERAVRAFQRSNGLTVDGLADEDTWGALAGSPGELRLGAEGEQVEGLQRSLARAGHSPGKIDGYYGEKTQSAVRGFQGAVGLSVDGIAGPRTQAALGTAASRFVPGTRTPERTQTTDTTPAATNPNLWGPKPPVATASTATPHNPDLRQRMLDVARGELGTLEKTGNNDGAVLKYPRAFGRGREPYCVDFVSWVAGKAGTRLNFAYTPSLVNFLKERGQWKGKSNPQPGDLVFFAFKGGRADHVGFVEKVNADGTLTTIEGNTSDPNSNREGVFRRVRARNEILGLGYLK